VTATCPIAATPQLPVPAFAAQRQRDQADWDGGLGEHQERWQAQDYIARYDLQAVPEHVAAPAVHVEVA
jgi:hypothetical protein